MQNGRKTNMKPPLRESRHSTSRMLVTRGLVRLSEEIGGQK